MVQTPSLLELWSSSLQVWGMTSMGREAKAGLREGVCRALHSAREGQPSCRVPSVAMVELGPLRIERLPEVSPCCPQAMGT